MAGKKQFGLSFIRNRDYLFLRLWGKLDFQSSFETGAAK
jgi:hypothetical protein